MTDHLTAPLTNRSLPIALLRAREKVMGPIRAMLSDVGVTEQQWRVLRVLDERGPLDPTEIADRSVLLLPSLTRILQTLVAKGLVSRAPHPTDRRKQVVSITANGQQLIADNLQQSQELTAWLRESFGKLPCNEPNTPMEPEPAASSAFKRVIQGPLSLD